MFSPLLSTIEKANAKKKENGRKIDLFPCKYTCIRKVDLHLCVLGSFEKVFLLTIFISFVALAVVPLFFCKNNLVSRRCLRKMNTERKLSEMFRWLHIQNEFNYHKINCLRTCLISFFPLLRLLLLLHLTFIIPMRKEKVLYTKRKIILEKNILQLFFHVEKIFVSKLKSVLEWY